MENSETTRKIMNFTKMQGAGDNFVFVNNTMNDYDFLRDNKPLISTIMDSSFGVGGNALIELQPCPGYDFFMKCYKYDGTRGGMCGNGMRCAAIFAYKEKIISKPEAHFKSYYGSHTAKFDITMDNPIKGLVEVYMKDVDQVDTIKEGEFFIDSGSPHYYKFVEGVGEYPILVEGPPISERKEYEDIQGANVNFVEWVQGKDGVRRLNVRIYERAVKREILACGTASVGAAMAAYTREFQQGNIQYKPDEDGRIRTEVVWPGATIFASFKVDDQCRFSDVWQQGPAAEVFTGQWMVE